METRRKLALIDAMKKPAQPGDYPCPVEAALDVIGGKWKGVILWHLHHHGTLRFGELRRLLPARLAQQALTVQLRELEADGVIHRQAYDQRPPKVEYSLTAVGRSLRPLLDALCRWGIDQQAHTIREPAVANHAEDAT